MEKTVNKEILAKEIVSTLSGAGHEAYFAGGSVRDNLMGHASTDIDIATSANPEQVMKIFKRTVPVGIQYGVVLVIKNGIPFEVTTFRTDGPYSDGRHPDTVTFTDAKHDVLRRDFTINGLLYDPSQKKVLDFVGGQDDIKKEVIRAIGDPQTRFEEDKLRIIRGVRFACRFGFKIEDKTLKAMKEKAPLITQVSWERIRDELLKILTENNPSEGIETLRKIGILEHILPEVTAMVGVKQPEQFHPEGDVYQHTILMLKLMERPSPELALASLLHDIGKPKTYKVTDRIRFDHHPELGARMAVKVCKRLKLSNDQTGLIHDLIRDHLKFMNVKKMRESTLKRFLRQPHFDEHLEMHRLDCLASHQELECYEFCKEKIDELGQEKLSPPRLITGDDLIKLGLVPGPIFSTILTQVEDAQLEGKLSTNQEAIDYVKEKYLNK